MICVNICKPLFNSKPGASVFHTFPYICRVFGSDGECPARLKGNRVRFSDSPAAVCQRPLRASPVRCVGSRREARRHCAMREKAPPSRLASQKTCQILSCSSCRGRHAFHAVIRSVGAEGASGEACRRENRCGPRGLGRCRGRAAGAVVRLSRLRVRRALFPFCLFPSPPFVFLPWRFVRLPCRRGRVVGNFFIQPY